MRHTIALLALLSCFSCAKEDSPAPPSGGNGGGGGGGGTFTPPTTSYWRINNVDNASSMDGVNVNILANQMGVNKPFPDLGFGYCQLRVFNDDSNLDVRAAVAEGGYKAYFITKNTTAHPDSMRVQLDVQDQNSSTFGNYFYRATGGKVYVSKSGGKLRFTSDGNLSMEGVKYPNMQDYIYNSQLTFSQVEP
ncbi:MAG: hypothetical protein KIT10_08870 [Flavobacteriales bacterium]|nr:hypothetical protein [Flavobacteriales bacterium]